MELVDRLESKEGHAVCLDQKPGVGTTSPLVVQDIRSSEFKIEEEGFPASDGLSDFEEGITSGSVAAEALFYALPYMSLEGLLTMERVCRYLRDCARNDVLLWQQLHVEPPLNRRFTDEALLKLASRSNGQLECLSLVGCFWVTDSAVEQVVSSNPRLTKLFVPRCSRISADAIIRMVKTHTICRVPGMPGLKQLRIENVYGLTREHLDSLLIMLADGELTRFNSWKPQFYHNGHRLLSCDEERPIDVEECPECANVRLVYDCTRERCRQRRGSKFQKCRACIFCIARCEECGGCIGTDDAVTFSLDSLCFSCWHGLPKCSACNAPGCGRHADHFIRTLGVLCGDCCGSPSAIGPEFHAYTSPYI